MSTEESTSKISSLEATIAAQKSEIEIYRKAIKSNSQREAQTKIVIQRLWEKVVELYGDSDYDSLAKFITECYQ